MADPYVREVGAVKDMDGLSIEVGVDYDTVSLQLGFGVAPRRLTGDQAEEFGRLFVAACWQAGQNARQMAEEVHEADGGDSMAACDAAEHGQGPKAPLAARRPAPFVAPFETGAPWRGPAQADWEASRDA